MASHKKSVSLFTLGEPASHELEAIAEAGDVGPMTDLLMSNSKVSDVANSGGLLPAGHSVTVEGVGSSRRAVLVSAAMLGSH